ncbi:MAG: magnesium/cobalt transporter CorA [Methanomassiliicoccales archaeon]
MAKARVITHLKRHYHEPGTAPGTLLAPPATAGGTCQIRVIRYGIDSFNEQIMAEIKDCCPSPATDQTTWINIEGDYYPELLEQLGAYYGLHRLSLEDTLNRGHRPKLEEYQEYLFIVLYLLEKQEQQQVSIFLMPKVIITMESHEYQTFDLLRQRLRSPQPGDDIRHSGVDYLAYAIADTLVDQFFPRLESYRERLDLLEEHLLDNNPARQLLADIHQLKMEMLVLGRLAWAERDVIASLERQHPQLAVYLRDSYDHMVQIIEMLETYRDITTGILDVYLSSVSNQMNNVMKTLTIIATIFIPLTFIVGVYGMNFDPATSPFNMPEINTRYGYPVVWALMLGIAGGMLVWFRQKKWL